MTLLLRKTLFIIAKIKKRIHSTKRIPLNRSKQAHPFPINRGARLHSVLRNVWGVEHCPREYWRAFKARVIRGCTTSEDKVCLCRVTHALARWHTLLVTGMAASRPSLCFYSPHFSILHFISHLSNTSKKLHHKPKAILSPMLPYRLFLCETQGWGSHRKSQHRTSLSLQAI